jgi:hypothetical protein
VNHGEGDWERYAPQVGLFYSLMTRYNWRWNLDASTAWFRWSGDELWFNDVGTTIAYFFWKHAAVFAGYRISYMELHDGGTDYYTRYYGPELGVSIRF